MRRLVTLFLAATAVCLLAIPALGQQCVCADYGQDGPFDCTGSNECVGTYYPSHCGGLLTNCYNCADQAGSGECCGTVYYSASTGRAWGYCGDIGKKLSPSTFEVGDGIYVPNCKGGYALVLPGKPIDRGRS